jgi:hypothetical protein
LDKTESAEFSTSRVIVQDDTYILSEESTLNANIGNQIKLKDLVEFTAVAKPSTSQGDYNYKFYSSNGFSEPILVILKQLAGEPGKVSAMFPTFFGQDESRAFICLEE